MVKRIQTAHLGIQSCLRRAQQLLHWRVLNQDVIGYIGRCPVCQKLKRANNEEPIPELRWQRVVSYISIGYNVVEGERIKFS